MLSPAVGCRLWFWRWVSPSLAWRQSGGRTRHIYNEISASYRVLCKRNSRGSTQPHSGGRGIKRRGGRERQGVGILPRRGDSSSGWEGSQVSKVDCNSSNQKLETDRAGFLVLVSALLRSRDTRAWKNSSLCIHSQWPRKMPFWWCYLGSISISLPPLYGNLLNILRFDLWSFSKIDPSSFCGHFPNSKTSKPWSGPGACTLYFISDSGHNVLVPCKHSSGSFQTF